MASNSPGMYSRSHQDIDEQDSLGIRGLLPDVNYPGKFHSDSGYHGDMPFAMESGYYVNTSDGASTCSSSTAETWELEGAALLVLESKSLRSFTTNDEYLYAMKEDLADWFSSLYQNYEITAVNLFQVLETGVLLCKHANKVQEFARQSSEFGDALEMRSYFIRSVPEGNVPYREGVKPETFQARDNVSNFITWTRELGIPQVLSFETDDLVMRKNEKSVILSLLEIARVGAKLGMLAPTLVQMEQEIDAELAGEEPPPQVQIKTCDLRSLDERVRDLISRCTCPVQFPMIKVGDGKYKIGDTRSLIFVRILRNHVMVRVGGGWDTLENYLNKHDPCQCHFKGHRSGTSREVQKVAANQQRRSSNPSHMTIASSLNPPTPQRQASPVTTTSRNRSASPQTISRASSPTGSAVSSNSPAPAKPASRPSGSSKAPCALPAHNQQENVALPGPLPLSSVSNSNAASQPIRSSSPRPGHIVGSSPLRSTPSATHPTVSSRVTPSSAVTKGRDLTQGSKTFMPKDTRSLKRSTSLEEHDTPYSEKSSSPSRSQLNLQVTTSQAVQKAVAASGKRSEVAGRKHTSQISEKEKNGKATPLGASRQRAHTASPSNSDGARMPYSHTKGHSPSSPLKSSKTSSGYGQKISSGSERTAGKESTGKNSELPSHLKADEVTDAACAISDWLESTSEVDLPGHSAGKEATQTGSVVASSPSVSQNLINERDREVDNQNVRSPAISTTRNRPATSSRIPKPCKVSLNAKPAIPSTASVSSLTSNTGLPNLHSLKNFYPHEPGITDVVSPLDFSSFSNEGQFDPDRNILSVDINSEALPTQSEEFDAISDEHSISSRTFPSMESNDSLTGGEPNTDGSNPALSSTHRKLSLGTSAPRFYSFGDNDHASSHQRRSSSDVRSHTSSLEHASWLPRASSTSNLETERQHMIINEITFSDDEEINELIKTSALKEKVSDRNMPSPSRPPRKAARQKAKDNDEILMIIRDGAGRHAVQLPSNEPKLISTPKSRATRTTFAGLKDSNPDRADSRRSSTTSNPNLLQQKPSPEDTSHLFPRPLEEIHKIIAESKNGFLEDETDSIHSPREKFEMFKNLEKLFREYREMELKAAVTDSSEREGGTVPSDKSYET